MREPKLRERGLWPILQPTTRVCIGFTFRALSCLSPHYTNWSHATGNLLHCVIHFSSSRAAPADLCMSPKSTYLPLLHPFASWLVLGLLTPVLLPCVGFKVPWMHSRYHAVFSLGEKETDLNLPKALQKTPWMGLEDMFPKRVHYTVWSGDW